MTFLKKPVPMLSPESLYNASITEGDITKPASIDPHELRLLTYSRPHDTCDGIELHLGNQAKGYPFSCLGQQWEYVEFLYLCGEWSWDGDDALAIQRDVLTAKSGYAARRFKKARYKKKIRPDFTSFRHQWMLWCVWQKCLGSKAYRDHLLSMPDDRVIVEVVRHDPVWAAWPDENGIYHGANGMGKILTICRRCLLKGTQPKFDSDLLNAAGIYILGHRIEF